MTSLFLDTSSITYTIAIIKDDKIIYHQTGDSLNKLSDIILTEIDVAFKSINLDIKDIDRIYLVNGPGSFTGIRIGLTFAKIVAYSLKKELVLLSKLEMLSCLKEENKIIVPVIDARRGYVYGAIYDNKGNQLLKDQYIKLDELKVKANNYNDTIYVSEQPIEGVKSIRPNYDLISLIKRHNEVVSNIHTCKPNYLKKTEAEEKNDKKNK